MKFNKRGFSLIEILIVLLLAGAALGLVATLISKTLETLRFLQEKGETLQSATLGGERLTSEMREMVEFLSSGDSTRVRFNKVNSNAPEAVGNDLADFTTLPAAWQRAYSSTLGAGDQRVTVLYEPAPNDKLERSVAFPGQPTQRSLVASHVNTFVVTENFGGASNCFQVVLSLQEKRRVVSFTSVVVCPGLRP